MTARRCSAPPSPPPAALAALVSAGAAGGAALAQELDPDANVEGKILSATISQRFEVNDNYDLDDPSPGTSYFTDTRLNLGFLNATDTQTFTLGLDTGLRALWRGGGGLQVHRRLADLRQRRLRQRVGERGLRRRPRTSASAGWTTSNSIDDFVTDEGALPDDLDQLQGDSYELRYDANVGVAFATNSPSQLRAALPRHQDRLYRGHPETRRRAPRSRARPPGPCRLTPVFSSIVFADYLTYDADNAAETSLRVAEIDAGVIYQPSENLLVRGGIGYADRKREDTNAAGVRETTQSDNGPSMRGDFRYTVQEDFVLRGNAALHHRGARPAVHRQPGRHLPAAARQPARAHLPELHRHQGGGNQARVTGASVGLVRDLNTVSRLASTSPWPTRTTWTRWRHRRAGHQPHDRDRRATATTSPRWSAPTSATASAAASEDPEDAHEQRRLLPDRPDLRDRSLRPGRRGVRRMQRGSADRRGIRRRSRESGRLADCRAPAGPAQAASSRGSKRISMSG